MDIDELNKTSLKLGLLKGEGLPGTILAFILIATALWMGIPIFGV